MLATLLGKLKNICKSVLEGRRSISQAKLVMLASLFLLATSNTLFFKKLLSAYELSFSTMIPLLSLSASVLFIVFFVLTVLCISRATKVILIAILIISSFVTYFGNVYDVVISKEMILNAFHTDYDESMDLLTGSLLISVFALGIIPSVFVWKIKIHKVSFLREIFTKLKHVLFTILAVLVLAMPFMKFHTIFIKEHKSIRVYVNPLYWMYSVGGLAAESLKDTQDTMQVVGQDAKISDGLRKKSKVVVMVVGEALRADRIPFNGYHRNTMPLMQKEEISNFPNMYSCGTSTHESVPCMFSIFDRKDYNRTRAEYTENIIDVLSHTGQIEVLWRENNSSSNKIADRVEYEVLGPKKGHGKYHIDCRDVDKKKFEIVARKNRRHEHVECRDDMMLVKLDEYIRQHEGKDIFIVFHQIGSHGPAYYKRYPKRFEKYKPTCKTSMLNECTNEEVGNTYDNTVLYTDYFLSETINFLKKYNRSHDVAMLYMSDHGESLGENGVYLHGMPYFMAPDAQKHIASFVWFGDGFKDRIDMSKLNSYRSEGFSHDNLPHTILGLFDVETKVYDQKKDILYRAQQ